MNVRQPVLHACWCSSAWQADACWQCGAMRQQGGIPPVLTVTLLLLLLPLLLVFLQVPCDPSMAAHMAGATSCSQPVGSRRSGIHAGQLVLWAASADDEGAM